MSAVIDHGRCRGCPGAIEPPCVRICPGDLVVRPAGGPASLRDPAECWDCAACVKACPTQAIALELPPVLGGRGSKLWAAARRGSTLWVLHHRDGAEERLIIP